METTALASSFLLLTAIMGQMENSDEAPILSLNRARLEMMLSTTAATYVCSKTKGGEASPSKIVRTVFCRLCNLM